MHTTFQRGPEYVVPESPKLSAPTLLVEWSSWPREFFSNLRWLLRARFGSPPTRNVDPHPGTFWPDVFVNRRLPLAPFRQSVLCHLLVVAAIWGSSHIRLGHPQIRLRSPLENSNVVYYPISDYLPALSDHSATEQQKPETKGQPVYARQRIRSVPHRSDNTRQTIVTPPALTIHNDVPLPNIVAWTSAEVPSPIAAATHMRTHVPASPLANPIPPPPQVSRTQMRVPALLAPLAVAPPPVPQTVRKSPALELPTPVAPAPSLQRQLGDLNAGLLTPSAMAPQLSVIQRSAVPVRKIGTRPLPVQKSTSAPIPTPALSGTGTNGMRDAGQLIALSAQPVLPSGPVQLPQGNRRGTFATGPEGKPEASGQSEMHGPGDRVQPGGGSSTGVRSPVPGLTVDSAPAEMAAVRPPRAAPRNIFSETLAHAADIPRSPRATPSAGPEPKVEDLGLGPKKYYSMALNMPNLASSNGSWIIRFAELTKTQDDSRITAPVATLKVDPAYPAELLRDGVEGVVTLYAIIRADGAVSAVRVLRGVDARLDASALAALQKWHFRPGTKKGNAIDLEAVVQVPFLSRTRF